MNSPPKSRLRAYGSKVRGFLGGRRDAEFNEEVQEHLQLLTERFAAQGMTREEAAAAARRQFGNTTLLQEDHRDLQTFPLIEALWRDLKYALRTLWKSRGFAAVSITTLGLGIGAATAIFSVVDNVVLSPFPYKGAGRMVFPRIHNTQQSQESGRQGWLRDAVVVMEVALSLTLLIAAGLLMRSFVALREVRLGLRADHVFQSIVLLPEGRYKTTGQVTKFFRPLLARLKASPGVVDAAASSEFPSDGGAESRMEVAGKMHDEERQALFQSVSEGYFRVLRIELKRDGLLPRRKSTMRAKLLL